MKVRIVGDEYVLSVARTDDLKAHLVRVFRDSDTALQNWGASTRSSPVFSLNQSKFPDLRGIDCIFCFMGPLHPARVPEGLAAFLTFGVYNILLVAVTPADWQVLHDFLSAVGDEFPWEGWQIKNGQITRVEYGFGKRPQSTPVDAGPIRGLPSELDSVAYEYRTLVAATRAKGRNCLNGVDEEVGIFDAGFRQSGLSEFLCSRR